MSKKTIKIPLRRVFEAMKQDPTPKITGMYVSGEGDNAPRCAVGGAAFVLGLDPDDLGEALEDVQDKDDGTAWDWITETNDGSKIRKSTIGTRGLKRYADQLDKELKVKL